MLTPGGFFTTTDEPQDAVNVRVIELELDQGWHPADHRDIRERVLNADHWRWEDDAESGGHQRSEELGWVADDATEWLADNRTPANCWTGHHEGAFGCWELTWTTDHGDTVRLQEHPDEGYVGLALWSDDVLINVTPMRATMAEARAYCDDTFTSDLEP
jgi:hypothetical protein